MKLQECIESLSTEKMQKIPSRFPCRVILLNNCADYAEAVSELKLLCDRTVSSDELFSGADVMPAYDRLIGTKKPDEWLLLPGVSDYLSLFSKSEQNSKRLSKLWHNIVDATNTGRVIIPLCNSNALWHDKSLGMDTDERQNDFVYEIDGDSSAPEQKNIVVFSSDFEKYVIKLSDSNTLIIGLREWYGRILDEVALKNNYCLLTRQARNVIPSASIRVVNDRCAFVKSNLTDGNVLNENECTTELLDELFEESLNNISVNEAILRRFNLVTFDGNCVLARWVDMSTGKKQLLKLWYRLNPDKSYLCKCFNEYEIDEIEQHILLDIFDLMQYHPDWADEARQLVSLLNIQKNDLFFKKLDKIPLFEDRLKFLSADTKEERVYIIRMIGQWLRKDSDKARNSEQLAQTYPLLYAYLKNAAQEIDTVYDEYIAQYKFYKLSNTLPDCVDLLCETIKPDTLPHRYSILNQYVKEDTIVLWIDAMGFEYLSILLSVLSKNNKGKVIASQLTQALLPTQTSFNEQWKQMSTPYEKLDKLDKLAHKGVVDEPDYYTCIEEQLSFFEKVSNKVDELINNYQRIIITADHGTSRLAARFFHTADGLQLPNGAKAFSHGRYCSITSNPAVIYESLKTVSDADGQKYLVFSNYNHFAIGGFASGGDDDNVIYGEVHGGASAEEMIVPVVVFDRKSTLPLSVKWADGISTVKIKKHIAKAKLEFSREIRTLQVKAGTVDAVCSCESKNIWSVVMEKIKPGEYWPIIIADGKLVNIDTAVTVVSALSGGGDI